MSQLTYHVHLNAPAIFAWMSEPAQVTSSAGHVPGSAVWGALADRWIAHNVAGEHAERDPDFRRLFLRSAYRFLNAYPAAPDSVPEAPGRTLPLPLSIASLKVDPESRLDLAVSGISDSVVPLRGCGRLDEGLVYRTEAHRSLNYHTRRDPRRGRPSEDEGALFIYESLDAGQDFVGLILGDAADLERLREVVDSEPGPLFVGRSRSAQYGGAASLKLDPTGVTAWSGEVTDCQASESRLVVTLTSALIPLGPPDPERGVDFPYDALAQLLGAAGARVAGIADARLDGAALRERQTLAITAEEVVSGFSRVWRLPRPQQRALAAGSVWVFDGIVVPESALLPVTEASLGGRIAEGYGRFVLNWHGLGPIRSSAGNWSVTPPRERTGPPPETFMQIVEHATRVRWEEIVRRAAAQDARDLAGSLESRQSWPSGSLLRRLNDLVRRMQLPREAARELSGWKPLARNQLRAARARQRTLLNLIETALDPDSSEHPAAAARLSLDDPVLRAYAPPRDETVVRQLTKTYLLTLLKVLAERRREALTSSMGARE